MKAQYKNATRSKQMIKQAMLKLMTKKDFSQITVTDIVKCADINRGTFYNHYGNPTQILEEIKDELMQKLAQALKQSTATKDVDGFVKILIDHFQKNETEYKQIANAIPMSVIDNLKQELIKQILQFDIKIDTITFYFVANGITGICLDFLKGNVTFTYDQFQQKVTNFLNSALNHTI